MKLGTSVFLSASAVVCAGLMAVLSVQGCSSSTTNNNNSGTDGGGSGGGSDGGGSGGGSDGGSSSGGTDAGNVDAGPSAVPPALPPGATASTQTTAQNFAIKNIYLGDELNATTQTYEWGNYGYNIDGLETTAQSTNVCTLATGAEKQNQTDGPGGVDNSFGKTIIPLLNTVEPNISATISNSIQAGSFTIMLDTVGLDSTATQTASGITGQVFGGVPFAQGPNADLNDAAPAVPSFTTADNWPLNPSFLATGTVIGDGGTTGPVSNVQSNIQLTGGYIVNGTYVSGAPTTITLTITVQGNPLPIKIQHAVVTFNHTAAGAVSGGIISGVILTTDLVNSLQGVAGAISPSFCNDSPAFQSIVSSIEAAADILHDGTNAAGTPCDAISIGIGFDGDQIGPPAYVGAPSTPQNSCATDGGADAN
jgi:hypothetical protein